jgi:glycosyltransferase involved in cell wall biosynthesis/SAM-dependent methyltransferase
MTEEYSGEMPMDQPPAMNSRAWWDDYFTHHWEANRGSDQTRHFMERLIANLPSAELAYLSRHPTSILDWGCAFGEGVACLQAAFPLSTVSGLDFSPVAIEEARRRHPDYTFISTEDGRIPASVDVIITSNCLEHFDLPLAVMRTHLEHCRKLYIALVPYNEYPLSPFHFAQFREESFPLTLDGFTRLHTVIVEVAPEHWNGPQLLVVYGTAAYLAERAADDPREAERAKWDHYYASLPLTMEDEATRGFNAEFMAEMVRLLPEGSNLLEAGCGAGWQSLALVRSGVFRVSLLDFAPAALKYARQVFALAQQPATFIEGDVFELGQPDFDLVFNAGSLEHYTTTEQVRFLQGMGSRSRRYVLALVPNGQCYWYWLWRTQQAAAGNWPYGKEIPLTDLSGVFEAAGLRFLGQAYMGAAWTEAFISSLAGIDDPLRRTILDVHRSRLRIPLAQRSYLIAALGCVPDAADVPDQLPAIWRAPDPQHRETESLATLNAALADALALRIGAESRLSALEQAEHALRARLDDQTSWITAEQGKVEALSAQLAVRSQEAQSLAAQLAEREQHLTDLSTQLADRDRVVVELSAQVADQERALAALHTQVAEYQQALDALRIQLTEREEAAQALTTQLAGLDQAARAAEAQLADQVRAAAELRAQLAVREATIAELEARLAADAYQSGAVQQAYAAQVQQISATALALRQTGDRLRAALEHTWAALETHHASGPALIGRFAERLWQRVIREGPRGWWRLVRWVVGHARGRAPADMGEFDRLAPIRARIRGTLDSEHLLEIPLTVSAVSDRVSASATADRKAERADGLLTNPPLISVLLPVYNHADMLGQAIESVLSQDYPRFELIVLDDGSTDDFEGAVRPFLNDRRLRVFRQANQRLPRALTHLQEQATGEFITWTSADNQMAPGMLRALAVHLLAHPDAVLVYGDTALIDDSGLPLTGGDYRPQNRDRLSPDVLRLYRSAQALGHEADNYVNACFMYRAVVGRALRRYADDLNGLEDYDFWLRIQKAGAIQHIGNTQPLYRYRVHARTMSAELLSAQRATHIARSEMLMALEARRRAYADQPFVVDIDPALPAADRDELRALVSRSALAESPVPSGSAGPGKRLRFAPPGVLNEAHPGGAVVSVHPDLWVLQVIEPLAGELHTIRGPRGEAVHPLAYKARQYRPLPGEIFADVTAPVLGCHLPLGDYPLDVPRCREIIAQHPDILFVVLDSPDGPDPALGVALRDGLTNVAYIGPAEWAAWGKPYHHGRAYQVYATFRAFWLPPVRPGEVIPARMYQTGVLLAHAAGRATFAFERAPDVESSPGVYVVNDALPLRRALADAEAAPLDHAIADRYLETWSPQGRFDALLRLANAATQDAVERPAFGGEVRPVDPPRLWPAMPRAVPGSPLRVLLHVETLDKGGLEQMVQTLANGLRATGVTVAVACAQRGGYTADRLSDQGVPVHVLNADGAAYARLLDAFGPHVVNTHYGHSHLALIRRRGIPIVETIHNMYVFYDAARWAAEREKRTHINHYIAVSEMVKAYFLGHMPNLAPEDVTVIANPATAKQIDPLPREEARRRIGIDPGAFLFLTLASFDGRKNQIGLLAAFETVAAACPTARLICAGNLADPGYYTRVARFRETLRAAPAIRLSDFTDDVATLYSAADCFVLSSIFEGWSVAASEALLYGLPLIHTDCGSARELCGADGSRGIVVPNPGGDPLALDAVRLSAIIGADRQANHDALAAAMQRMIAEQTIWAARREAIAAHARAQFAVQRAARAYIGVYTGMIAPQSPRSA